MNAFLTALSLFLMLASLTSITMSNLLPEDLRKEFSSTGNAVIFFSSLGMITLIVLDRYEFKPALLAWGFLGTALIWGIVSRKLGTRKEPTAHLATRETLLLATTLMCTGLVLIAMGQS